MEQQHHHHHLVDPPASTRFIAPLSRNLTSPYDPVLDPPYLTVWELEKFSLDYWRVWLGVNWTWSVVISVAYLTTIFVLQLWMKQRPPFQLRNTLTSWNIFLAVFSMFGTARTWPEMMFILGENPDGFRAGFHLSVCKRDNHNQASAFWGLLFTLSKAVELGDTIFIVLRKQPLIFLHWYHHITVLGYTWYTYETYDATSRWFMVMNYCVHSLMYTYYALKSLRVRVPRPAAMLITTLQLSQMVIGTGVNLYAFYVKSRGVPCQVDSHHIDLALIMYVSYFILFGNFFYSAYFSKRAQARRAKAAAAKGSTNKSSQQNTENPRNNTSLSLQQNSNDNAVIHGDGEGGSDDVMVTRRRPIVLPGTDK